MNWADRGARMAHIEFLEQRKSKLVSYALMKLEDGDYHGAADACMDLREIDAVLVLMRSQVDAS